MFEFLRKEKAAHKQVVNFVKQEQKRREEAERFITFATSALLYVAEDLWGGSEDSIPVGKNVFFNVEQQTFLIRQKRELDDIVETDSVDVFFLKGRPFWMAVQEIMEYAHNLLEDIQKKELSRNLLVGQMQVLNKRMEKSPTFGASQALRNMSL